MSALSKIFGGTTGISSTIGRESLANQLLTSENLPTKTEIENPLAFSLLDVLAVNLSTPEVRNKALKEAGIPIIPDMKRSDLKVGDTLTVLARALRINYVSHKRQSRYEFVDVTKGVEMEGDRIQRRIEKMFGSQME